MTIVFLGAAGGEKAAGPFFRSSPMCGGTDFWRSSNDRVSPHTTTVAFGSYRRRFSSALIASNFATIRFFAVAHHTANCFGASAIMRKTKKRKSLRFSHITHTINGYAHRDLFEVGRIRRLIARQCAIGSCEIDALLSFPVHTTVITARAPSVITVGRYSGDHRG
jgi:hypothetical protein